ncbi:MAG: CBS domain-containing protein [Balneolaceae bacterium]|nr:CBS domain-containing protein [Balneolaceae bacterium]
MQVNKILNTKGNDVYYTHPEETVYNAIFKMSELKVGALLVMKRSELVGIISERDYRNKIILKGRTSKTTEVQEIMTSDVITVSPNDTVNTCMQIMTDQKIRHLPVVEGGGVYGVISIGDVVKAVIEQQQVEIDSLRGYIKGGYPA